MLCADCNHQLSPITLTGHSQNIDLDYCGHCGGIWTDTGETNFLDDKSLVELTDLLPEEPAPDVLLQQPLCPRDRNIMTVFRGESVPYDLAIFRCGKCNGFWFPYKGLFKFKSAQASKISYTKNWKIPLPSIYSVALPLLLLLVLGTGLVAVLSGVDKNTDLRTRAQMSVSKPLVIHPDANSVILSFNTEKAVISKIKYWQRPNSKTESWVSNVPKTNHTVQLKNLTPDVTYSYQLLIKDDPETESPVYTFTIGE